MPTMFFVCPAGLIQIAEKLFQCDECDKCFRTKSLLHQHALGKHAGGSHGICDLCGREFNWRTSYLNHIKSCKGNVKDKKGAAVKSEFDAMIRDDNVELSFDEGGLVTFPDDIGEEVIVVPIPYEGSSEEFVSTTFDGHHAHETIGATQEIAAEIVPEEQFYFQSGLQPVAYFSEEGHPFFVSKEEFVKDEIADELV